MGFATSALRLKRPNDGNQTDKPVRFVAAAVKKKKILLVPAIKIVSRMSLTLFISVRF